MPRLPRTVFPNMPHHITQRGNRREQVFFTDDDRLAYLRWLREYAGKFRLDLLAYCLMSNHVHLVAVPATEDGLHRMLKPVHMRYAQRINRLHGWQGHVWQGRFFSSVLDETYVWAAIRYVERNPVRAKMVSRAEDFRWSSAGAHCGLRCDPVLTRCPSWREQWKGIGDWSDWLAEGDEPSQRDCLRVHADKGLPCGSPAFIEQLRGRYPFLLKGRSQQKPLPPERRG